MRCATLLVLAGALLGCKSHKVKAADSLRAVQDSAITLRYEVDRACFLAAHPRAQDTVVRVQADCDLARRALAKFMSGR
jgi:hypothetical protein